MCHIEVRCLHTMNNTTYFTRTMFPQFDSDLKKTTPTSVYNKWYQKKQIPRYAINCWSFLRQSNLTVILLRNYMLTQDLTAGLPSRSVLKTAHFLGSRLILAPEGWQLCMHPEGQLYFIIRPSILWLNAILLIPISQAGSKRREFILLCRWPSGSYSVFWLTDGWSLKDVSSDTRWKLLFVSHNSQHWIMKREEIICWFGTMVNSEDFILFVTICDSYKVWNYLASCFEKR